MTGPESTIDGSHAFRTDPSARSIVITGATDGMGRVAAVELARGGARLLLIGRKQARCEAVRAECAALDGDCEVDYVAADLSTVREVQRAAAEIRRRLDRVDTLVNNAGGVFPWRRTETSEGVELALMLQYLQRFVLTRDLLDLLHASADPLVMVVAGGGTYARGLDLDDLQSTLGYRKFAMIGKSAALNELLAQELIRRQPRFTCCNYGPGLVRTKTTMGTPPAWLFFQSIGRIFSRSAEEAGADIARLAMGGNESGFYCPDLQRNEPGWAVAHPELGPMLWDRTEALLEAL
jgi:NAD(P)-dependent dehydrogenase (short-subunit alcohol dehydrogenase family)